ncbi:hypothetical protein BD413DRAFT_495918 [Trametes elegans]|nr:hypothetical protein BD413DRAFT_495918 [Trametes elegans]
MNLPPEVLSTVKESTGFQIIGFALATSVFDMMTTLLMAHALYTYNVLDFGDPLKQFDITWSYALENGLTVVIAFIVQCYFGCRLWLFSRKNRVLIGMIFLMTFGNLFGGLWITVELFIRPAIPELGTVKIRILTGAIWAQAVIIPQTSVVALPGRVVFLPFAMLENKLYTNVLLATLNVRQSLRGDKTVELRSTSFTSGPSQSSGHTLDAARPGALQFREGSLLTITQSPVATIEFTHPTLQNELKKPAMSL